MNTIELKDNFHSPRPCELVAPRPCELVARSNNIK